MKFFSALILLFSCQTYAETTLTDYKKYKDSNGMKSYVYGLGVGYAWANAELRSKQLQPLYCQPDNLALTSDNYIQLLDDGIRKETFVSYLIEPLLLDQLIKTFPCKK